MNIWLYTSTKEEVTEPAKKERKVREDLESKGWIVDKFSNNIDLENSCFVKAKYRFINGRPAGIGSGFPDFVAWMPSIRAGFYSLIFVECKINGTLNKEEKLKMEWLKKNGYECKVASKNGTSVEYKRPNCVFRKSSGDKAWWLATRIYQT